MPKVCGFACRLGLAMSLVILVGTTVGVFRAPGESITRCSVSVINQVKRCGRIVESNDLLGTCTKFFFPGG